MVRASSRSETLMIQKCLVSLVLVTTIAAGCKKEDAVATADDPTAPGTSQNEASGEVLAEIDGYKITVGDFQERINKQSPYVRARYTSKERKKEFLDNLIRFEVMAKEATSRGLDNDPEVVRTMKQVMIQKLMKKEFETRVKLEDITDEEMKAYYEQHTAEYNKPEEVRVTAVIVNDKAKAKKVAKLAKGPLGKNNNGFRDLVNAHTEDVESKKRGGDLRYFPRDAKHVPAAVVTAAFELAQTGDVAGPIAVDGKFYIIKRSGHRRPIAKIYEDIKKQIQSRIYREKRTKAMEDFVAALRKDTKIEVFEDKLAKIEIDTSAPKQEPTSHGGNDPHALPQALPKQPSTAPSLAP